MARKRVYLALSWRAEAILKGIMRYARGADWVLVDPPFAKGVFPRKELCDGMLSILNKNSGWVVDYCCDKIPLIDMAWSYKGKDIYRVIPDEGEIAKQASQYYLSKAFKQYVTVEFTQSWVEAGRCKAFRQHLKKVGVSSVNLKCPMPEVFFNDPSRAWAWFASELERLPKPIALFAGSDGYASFAVNACIEHSLRVPQDVAVLGVDNDELICEFAPRPLSSVDSNLEELGYRSSAILDQLMAGKRPRKKVERIPPKGVVERLSTEILASQKESVRRSLEFIRKRYRFPITTEDVVAYSRVSRTQLYQDFDEEVGHTVSREIIRLRINALKMQSTDPNLRLEALAKRTGFVDKASMCRSFKRETGMTITQYRKKLKVRFF